MDEKGLKNIVGKGKVTQQSNTSWDGRIPPKALDLEEAVLGAMLLEKEAPVKVLDVLSPEAFYSDSHQTIFKAVRLLFEKGEPIDVLTITDSLRQAGTLEACGGAFYIASLTGKVASSANIEYHAKILIQKFIQRELIRVSGDIIGKSYDETSDAFELLDMAEQELFAIKNESIKKNYDSIDSLIHKAIQQIESLKDTEGGFTGVPSGFASLDRITAGWQKSDLVILAGRPGMGKTAFVLNVARNAAIKFQKPIAIFSLEMSSLQLVTRLISSETGITSDSLKTGNLDDAKWEQLNTKIQDLSNAPIYVDDTPQLSIFDLRAKARRLKSNMGIELLVIDYLQLMRGDINSKGNREQEISHISRSLKGLAKELDIPIIALAQLSRAVEQRNDKRPILSDLRESGSIEQDADLVGFLYRPDYYGQTQDEAGNDITGLTEFIIAKHRNGRTGKALLRFVGELAKFEDYELPEFNPNVNADGNLFDVIPSKLNEFNDFPSEGDEIPPF
jgi:replicative DNA helicase